MKYVIILGDGMADDPIKELNNMTPLEYAKTPAIDEMAPRSIVGLVHTIPNGMQPGSDTANLSVIGYDPKKYYTGRSPLEALSIGVNLKDTDIAIRCNIVTLSDDDLPYEQKTMVDHSSSEISTKDASVLIEAVRKELEDEVFQFYHGTSYRHLTVWNHGKVVELTPPHDILENKIRDYLPKEELLRTMMIRSYEILNEHPLNQERARNGLNKANSIWFWGAGTKPTLDSFYDKTHKKGAMISAVDLLKGIAVGAGMTNIEVEGADGTLHTNYEGKADAAVRTLVEDGYDFVYIHVEAPDEMGHQGNIKNKVTAIEYLDNRVIKRVKEQLDQRSIDYRMLILPDHPTPIACRTHTSEPVPFMLYDSTMLRAGDRLYSEKSAKTSSYEVGNGYELIDQLFHPTGKFLI